MYDVTIAYRDLSVAYGVFVLHIFHANGGTGAALCVHIRLVTQLQEVGSLANSRISK